MLTKLETNPYPLVQRKAIYTFLPSFMHNSPCSKLTVVGTLLSGSYFTKHEVTTCPKCGWSALKTELDENEYIIQCGAENYLL